MTKEEIQKLLLLLDDMSRSSWNDYMPDPEESILLEKLHELVERGEEIV